MVEKGQMCVLGGRQKELKKKTDERECLVMIEEGCRNKKILIKKNWPNGKNKNTRIRAGEGGRERRRESPV